MQEYWLTDPEKQTVTQLVLKDDQLQTVHQADGEEPTFESRVLKNLTVDIRSVFE